MHWFNRRTRRLLETQHALRQTQSDLERRVKSRTADLEIEIEHRNREDAEREARRLRVEGQHAAIVRLSTDNRLSEVDIAEAARIVTEEAGAGMDVSRVSVWLMNEAEGTLDCIDLYDLDRAVHEEGLRLALADHPTYIEALERERSLSIENLVGDDEVTDLKDYARSTGVVSLLDAPLRSGGRLAGVVCFEHIGVPRRWKDDEVRFAGEIADQIHQVLAHAARRESEQQIRQLAFYDPLTGLANRRLLYEALRHELAVSARRGRFGSLLYLDLDNFKTLNDSLGHAVGDGLLVQVAARLRNSLRGEDLAARLGGDEFVVLLSAESDSAATASEQAASVAEKVRAAVSEPYHLSGYEHVITTSIGITLYPEGNPQADDVLKHADAAMYRAKQEGRNRMAFYDPQMQAAAERRLLIERELRLALRRREFTLHFQPQVDHLGRAVGIEALVRWAHPRHGMVGPAEFIGVAEETGLILELGDWVLEEACRRMLEVRVDHVAVNISPLQFRHPDFVQRVGKILESCGADPARLMVEVTEGVVIEDIEDAVAKMNALKGLGVRFAIDDFGTGYSSLAYLKRLPLDQLKIANEFVRDVCHDPNDAVIVETIIAMAGHLGLALVAEGVETAEQVEFLVARGCGLFQGYHFGRPAPLAEIPGIARQDAPQSV